MEKPNGNLQLLGFSHPLDEPGVKNVFLEPPLSANLDCRDLPFLQEPVDRDEVKPEILGRLFGGHDLGPLPPAGLPFLGNILYLLTIRLTLILHLHPFLFSFNINQIDVITSKC